MVSSPQTLKESARSSATYRLVVRSAEEAVQTIQAQWGGQAKVVSVRQMPGQGLSALFGRPRLEVIARVGDGPAVEAVASGQGMIRVGASASRAEVPSAFPEPDADSAVDGRAGAEETRDRVERADELPSLTEVLRRAGFTETLRARLQLAPEWQAARHGPLHRQVVAVGNALRVLAEVPRTDLVTDRVAFLGTAGSGRTTALAKWIAARVASGEAVDRVVQWSDGETVPHVLRQAALAARTSVVTVPFGRRVDDARSGGTTLALDCAAFSVTDEAQRAMLRRGLDHERIATRVLVLNALYDLGTLQRMAGAGRELGATHVVFTHLDELCEWGRLWDLLIEGELSPLFLSTGPAHDHGREDDVVAAVLRRTVPGAGRNGR